MSLHCDFCSEFSGSEDNAFARTYRQVPKGRALLLSEEFAVLPSLGQIAEGHLLLLPVTHFTALADLTERLSEELTELVTGVTEILREEYGDCVTFEHGVRPGGAGGCGIYHAHLHALPFPAAHDPVEFLKSQFPCKQIQGLHEVRKHSDGMVGYLFYQDTHSRAYLFDVPNLVSQYMRRIMADALGIQEWDWRDAGREERLLATLDRLSGRFENLRSAASADGRNR